MTSKKIKNGRRLKKNEDDLIFIFFGMEDDPQQIMQQKAIKSK